MNKYAVASTGETAAGEEMGRVRAVAAVYTC